MHNHSVFEGGVDFDESLWQKPETIYDESLDNQGCKGLFIRSDYNNQESYAFAYLGLPEGELKNKPAILLLHGGGGTAYYEWVNAWKEKGYIALAVDLEGHIPNKEGKITDYPQDLYHQSTYVAPHNQNLGDENDDLSLTWLHYACRTAIIANSFLHNLEGVDKYSIGISGVSWGGFITSIITGYDDRFAYAIPYYCTVNMVESGTPIGSYILAHPKFKVFDSVEPLMQIETPFKLIVSDIDTHENVLIASEVANLTKNGELAIINQFLHSHYHALAQIEGFAFAEEVLANNYRIEMKWKTDEELEIKLPKGKEVRFAAIHYTTEETVNKDTKWVEREISSDNYSNSKIKVSLKEGTRHYYVSFIDEKGATHSSPVQSL